MFQELKLGKKHKYIIFKINNEKTEIIVEKPSTSTDYDDFIADLPEDACRWAVYDLEFEKEEGGRRNKIVFYSWYVLNPTHQLHYRMRRPIIIVYRRHFYRHRRRYSGANRMTLELFFLTSFSRNFPPPPLSPF